jgi:2'-5' RNA ligase
MRPHTPEQSSLVGFDPAPRPTDRLFFAIFPADGAAARIAELARHLRGELGLKGRPLAIDRFHVTLVHLGDFVGLPKNIVEAARTVAAAVAAPPFEIVFDRVESFGGGRAKLPFVLRANEGVVALTAFQQTLVVALAKAGLGSGTKSSYTPHVTLLYDKSPVPGQAVETVAWTAHEFVLVRSLLGRTRHVALERWPLQR